MVVMVVVAGGGGGAERLAISWLATPFAGETSVFRSLALINIWHESTIPPLVRLRRADLLPMYYCLFFPFFLRLLMPFNCFPSCWEVVERSVDRWLRLLNPERRFARCEGEITSHGYLTHRENSWNWYRNALTIIRTSCAVHHVVTAALPDGKNEFRQTRNEKARFISVVRRTSRHDNQKKHRGRLSREYLFNEA